MKILLFCYKQLFKGNKPVSSLHRPSVYCLRNSTSTIDNDNIHENFVFSTLVMLFLFFFFLTYSTDTNLINITKSRPSLHNNISS